MATTPNIDLPIMDAAARERSLDYNEAIYLIDALLPGTVISDAVASPPASPADGGCYIVASLATGAWTGWEGDLAVYIGGAWLQISPKEGWSFWVQNKDLSYVYKSGIWVARIEDAPEDGTAYARQDAAWVAVSVTGGIHDLPLSFAGTPAASEVMQRYTVLRAVTCPADFAGSAGSVEVNPASPFLIDVRAAGASIGTITIDAAGSFSFATVGGVAVVIAAGSKIEFVAPAAVDATILDISAALWGDA